MKEKSYKQLITRTNFYSTHLSMLVTVNFTAECSNGDLIELSSYAVLHFAIGKPSMVKLKETCLEIDGRVKVSLSI